MYYNRITRIRPEAFGALTSLQRLALSSNALTEHVHER